MPQPTKRLRLALLCLAASVQADDKAPPKIACDDPVHDFGRLHNTNTVEHTFTIRNEGGSLLHISHVQESCGIPPYPRFLSTVLQPRETIQIPVTLPLRHRFGPLCRTYTVHSNDPKQPQLRLAVEGVVLSDVTWSPLSIPFGELRPGERVTREFTITNRTTTPMKITGVETRNRVVTHEWKTVRKGFEYKLIVTNLGTIPPGRFYDLVTVHTDSGNEPAVRVTAFGLVEAPVEDR